LGRRRHRVQDSLTRSCLAVLERIQTILEINAADYQPYVDALLDRGIAYGLLGPREGERIWDRHILNSLALVNLIGDGSSVIDIGSGAGLPGIPLAIARPDLQLTLLEPMLRRTSFLESIVEELGLSARVQIVRERAEDHAETYDVVVARAVAPLDRLLRWCGPMLSDGGVLLALKGRSAEDEIRRAEPTLRAQRRSAAVLEVRAQPTAEPTRIVRVR
jgi:16S rRNA (guanine527-N7)-methyltransferase